MSDRMSTLIRRLSLVQLIGGGLLFWTIHLMGQSPEVLGERVGQLAAREALTELAVDSVRSRLDATMSDVAVLKSDMTEVKWLGRTVAAGMAGLLISGVRRRKDEHDEE